MPSLIKVLSLSAALVALIGVCVEPAAAAPVAPPATTANGVSTQTGKASDAFVGLQDFLNMPAAERSQFNVYYTIRIKHADPALVHISLSDQGRTSPINIAGDGKLTPLPTRDQLNRGATVAISGPQEAGVAMKLHVFSTQPNGKEYDAAGLATGIRQGNSAMNHFAGILAIALKKLDRVYFPGGGSGTVELNGQSVPLPRTATNGEYPAGTPYFVPGQMGGATRIHLSNTPSIALFDTPSK